MIEAAYREAAALGPDGKPTGDEPSGDFPAAFADAIHAYASAGVVPGAVSGGGDKSIIESFLATATGNSPAVVADFAAALASYWSGVAVVPGIPAHGGVAVVGVVNDALSRVPLFEAAIAASITDELTEPGFLALLENVQTMAVSTIVWSVSEVMPNATTVIFPEGIS